MRELNLKKLRGVLTLTVLLTICICAVILFFFKNSFYAKTFGRIIQILEPFIYGGAIAYLLRPAVKFFERHLENLLRRLKKPVKSGSFRMVSILLSLLIALLLVILLIMTVLPELISSITGIVRRMPAVMEQFSTWIATLDQGGMSHELVVYVQQVADTLTDHLQNFLQTSVLPNLQTVITNVTSSFMGILSVLKNVGLGCIIAAYLLGSWERFMAQAKLIVYAVFPESAAEWIRKEVHFTDRMFSGFIIGKLVDSLIIGLICFAFMMLFSMPYAMLISVIVGVTNIIPFFGPYLGAIPSLVLILTVSPVKCLIFLAFIILLQQFDGNILGPAILGDRLGLSGFWILFSIMIFSSLWGIVGMLIGVPLFAVIYDIIRSLIRWLLNYREQDGLMKEYENRYPEKPEQAKKPVKSAGRKFSLKKR